MGGSGGLVLKFTQARLGHAPRQAENFNSYHLLLFVEVQDDARRDCLGLDVVRLMQPQIECVGPLVHKQLHSLSLIVRSKYTVTTRGGVTCGFRITRNTRLPCCAILPSRCSRLASLESGSIRSGAARIRSSHSNEMSRSCRISRACCVNSYFIRHDH